MSPESIASISQHALWTALLLSAPLLGVALVVGVLVSVFQAATQINEMTLSFVPKVLAMALVLIIGGPWMLGLIMHFTIQLFHNIPHLINS
ncbi:MULTISPECIES: flagellar biosynthesis protein FliQ [Acidithiobacillus]|jgi:flagellar biosynthetic protein FliQ|uniref:Flagellar biosynthetic protein FliQ n=3 Tax=Acidithiobacillus caldus TaxID=33059 RepID=F9ZNA0_ACICS|nr:MULTISPECIES: flagellar biosynthesis protein FliQ [Acidithiobacillus]AEK58143.1 Flagellar biosynthesis protein fliQ [Acidithiobacillus caldus SM-1]AIA55131.1 Flagellar biosynthesis protein FliQ [Acidithiobacillus caldus ATCC 51756]AUW32784.1 flagellar biosynthesis protein FliQ [Acidithiobacillus caldus]MBU2730622.1 flagellar biosynthesis protein FliQ [Acidithiobacillus caldus]MBU2734322.1 flagellar biosynthesis protein FliQ [Acidithiobacillus caldus ATCC 51756]